MADQRGLRVVLATDGSEAAGIALDLAAAMDWPPGSVIRLLTVARPVEAVLVRPWTAEIQGEAPDAPDVLAMAQAILEHAQRRLARSGATIERVALKGRPATEIVGAAQDFEADLLIIGSRGHGQIGSMLLGSVSAEVVDHSSRPVLVARRPTLNQIILGVDGSELARVAEDLVGEWPIFSSSAVEAVSVASIGLPWITGLTMPPQAAFEPYLEAGRQSVADHRTLAEEAAARLTKAGRYASARVVEGDPATELIRAADDDQADLIVVGTHGRAGLTRLMLGSVARNVLLHAHCSVMVVP